MAKICNFLGLVTIGVFTVATATDYCNLQSCAKEDSHTMCKYPSPTPAAACGNRYNIGFRVADKENIVNLHNRLRRKVASGQEIRGSPGPQPPAVSMPDLAWDYELENIAQRWVIQCSYESDKCRNVDRFVVGQNRAFAISPVTTLSYSMQMIESMYDGVDKFDRNHVFLPYADTSESTSYTQIVWANTTKIGCGQIEYYTMDGEWKYYFVVCNYGPSGNVIGDLIYEAKV